MSEPQQLCALAPVRVFCLDRIHVDTLEHLTARAPSAIEAICASEKRYVIIVAAGDSYELELLDEDELVDAHRRLQAILRGVRVEYVAALFPEVIDRLYLEFVLAVGGVQ